MAGSPPLMFRRLLTALVLLPLGATMPVWSATPFGGGMPAPGVDGACGATVDRVAAQWRLDRMAAPAKPLQAVVPVSRGHAISGAAYTFLTDSVRAAAAACRAGRMAQALQILAVVAPPSPSSAPGQGERQGRDRSAIYMP